MEKRRKPKIEFRYYQMPQGVPVLALLGKDWIRQYGKGIDYLHFHNFMEIGFCHEGEGTMTIGDKNYRFKGNEFTVIPSHFIHTTTSDEGTLSRWEYLYIDVDAIINEFHASGNNYRKAERMIRQINARAFFMRCEEGKELSERILKILNIMRNGTEYYIEEAKGELAALMAVIARVNQDDCKKDAEVSEDVTAMISEACDYIKEHYMEQIRIEDLAKLCHISEVHFRRLFNSNVKMSPLEYINLVRIHKACEMLGKTDFSVANVAYQCGFQVLSTFNRNFKQVTGQSPMDWRNNVLNSKCHYLKFDMHSRAGW